MTYTIIAPNASQSPGLFPAQCNTNWQRLLDIINNDHNFLNTASAPQGIHRQCTMINRAAPVGVLPAGNGIFYSRDDSGASQLHWYNGATDYQITPVPDIYPVKIVNSATLGAGATQTIFADPGYKWAGTGWAVRITTNTFTYQNLLRSGSNDVGSIDNNGSAPPTFLFSGNDLQIRNNDLVPRGLSWQIIYTRID